MSRHEECGLPFSQGGEGHGRVRRKFQASQQSASQAAICTERGARGAGKEQTDQGGVAGKGLQREGCPRQGLPPARSAAARGQQVPVMGALLPDGLPAQEEARAGLCPSTEPRIRRPPLPHFFLNLGHRLGGGREAPLAVTA